MRDFIPLIAPLRATLAAAGRRPHKRRAALLPTALGACVLFTAGCSPVSLSTRDAVPAGKTVAGMPYYLPIGKITIRGEFTNGAKPSDKPTVTIDPVLASASGADKKPSTTTAETTVGTPVWTITIKQEMEADPEGGAYAIPNRNYIYDDDFHVTVNPANHLLNTANTTAEDKTVQVIGDIAAMIAQFTGAGAPNPDDPPQPPKLPPPFFFTFHPSRPGEVAFVRAQLKERKLTFNMVPVEPPADKNAVQISKAESAQLEQRGLVFRPTMIYNLTLEYKPDDKFTIIHMAQQFVLPDTRRRLVVDYSRMPFVKKVTEVGFSDGMLVDFHQNVPSPVVGFLGIPKAILQAIIPLLGPSAGTAAKSGAAKPGS